MIQCICLINFDVSEWQTKRGVSRVNSKPKDSSCNNKTNNLSIRNRNCEVCGNENELDINVSTNIVFEGINCIIKIKQLKY